MITDEKISTVAPDLAMITRRLTHKIRSPLCIISSANDQLESNPETQYISENKALMDMIDRATFRIEEILFRFSQYACPEPSHLKPIDLSDFCRTKMAAYFDSIKCQNDHIQFCPEPDDSPGEIWSDFQKLKLILSNAIQNSYQSISGEGTITLRTSLIDGYVVITVEDTGDGIDHEFVTEAFMPFSTNRPGLVGLGLAIASRMADDINGIIEIAPRPEGGTLFTLKIPQKAVTDNEE